MKNQAGPESGAIFRGRRSRSVVTVAVGLFCMLLQGFPMAMPTAAELSSETAPMSRGDEGAQLMLHHGDGRRLADAPLLNTSVDIQVNGLIARARVVQRFQNLSDDWVEGVYVFPLPDMAAVDHMEMRIGERIIVGDIKEKKAAQRTYQQARKAGKQASLLRQERPNIFTSAVANIPPGGELGISLEYQQQLQPDGERHKLRLPLVVGPRYIPGKPIESEPITEFDGGGWSRNTHQVPDASRITPPVLEDDQTLANPVDIRINLSPGFELATLRSLHHPILTRQIEGNLYLIELANETAPADRDFVLEWQAQPDESPQAALFTEQWRDEHYALLMLTPPHKSLSAEAAPVRELILVIDTSGSMHGASIAQAKAALRLALQRLHPTDRFNVIRFSNDLDSLYPQARTASRENLSAAARYVDRLEAEGGTEMLPAMRLALRSNAEQGRLRQLVFLTDGAVGNEQALFNSIQQSLGDSRLFTVGIGSAPNSYFMSRAARFGRGSFTHIGSSDEVGERMQALFRKLESPALTDIALTWQGGQPVSALPERIPDLYFDEPLMLSLKADAPLTGLTVSGRFGNRDWRREVSLQGGADRAGLHVLWARRRIADLMAERSLGVEESAIRESIVEVALKHHLVSRHTSLVAVDKTPVRALDETLQRKALPTHLPQGWSRIKVFGGLPQTDTPAALHLLFGITALLGALGLFRRRSA